MERVRIGTMMFMTTIFLMLIPNIMSRPSTSPRPLCMSQFALVNQACSMLPFHHHIPHSLETQDGQHPPERRQEDKVQVEHEHGHGEGHESRREHRLRHSHHHHHHLGEEVDCCRWLKEVDTLCVCELLFHLPPFLKLPAHSYMVSVGDECKVTYTCPGR